MLDVRRVGGVGFEQCLAKVTHPRSDTSSPTSSAVPVEETPGCQPGLHDAVEATTYRTPRTGRPSLVKPPSCAGVMWISVERYRGISACEQVLSGKLFKH